MSRRRREVRVGAGGGVPTPPGTQWQAGLNTELIDTGDPIVARTAEPEGASRVYRLVEGLTPNAAYVANAYSYTDSSLFGFFIVADVTPDLLDGDFAMITAVGPVSLPFTAPANGAIYIGFYASNSGTMRTFSVAEAFTVTPA